MIRIPAVTFIGPFLQHVLSPGFKRIRHYGLLSPAKKRQCLAAARKALHLPEPSPPALEAAEDFMHRVAHRDLARCPCCGRGTLQKVVIFLPERSAVVRPHLAQACLSACRGPPP